MILPGSVRYLLVGGTSAALHNIIIIAGDTAGLHYSLSSAISFIVVTSFSYFLHAVFTFREATSLSSFARYVLGMAANYPLTVLALSVLVDFAGLPIWVAAPLATIALMLWNVIAVRWAILRPAA